MRPQFVTTRRVEFVDTDLAGIMHFSNYYRYMEQAEHEYFRSLGLDIHQVNEDGSIVGWPRVKASCTFEAPARCNDLLELRLHIERKGVKSLTIVVEFWKDEQRLAHGKLKTVCCRFRHGEPMQSIEIPPPYSDLIAEAS